MVNMMFFNCSRNMKKSQAYLTFMTSMCKRERERDTERERGERERERERERDLVGKHDVAFVSFFS